MHVIPSAVSSCAMLTGRSECGGPPSFSMRDTPDCSDAVALEGVGIFGLVGMGVGGFLGLQIRTESVSYCLDA